VIGREARRQIRHSAGRLPDIVIACVGGGSNAIGIFSAFIKDRGVKLIGVEAAGGASLQKGRIASLHGSLSYACKMRMEIFWKVRASRLASTIPASVRNIVF